ncbi:MAG: serpin family protein [Bacteroidales bacterium]|nr:serpin family protein [Bacteroidales bacterium]
MKLFGELAASGKDNVFVSPMGVVMLNLMLANGAEGETYNQIVGTMGMDRLTKDEINAYYKMMYKALSRADKKVSFSLANSLWMKQDFSFNGSYKNVLKNVYSAEAYTVDFTKSATLDQINRWSDTKTSGMVPKILEYVNGATVMMLANAIYFKGDWTNPFKKEATVSGTFTSLDGTKQNVMYMCRGTKDLTGYADEEVCVVRMPYGNGAFYMEAILPATDDFASFVKGLSKDKLVKWGNNTTEAIDLQFPKMDVGYDTGDALLTGALMNLGMTLPFSNAADFSGISKNPVNVDVVRQKAKITVDETGTVAAATGLTALRGASGHVSVITQMHFNHPFVYMIRESSTGAILFMGSKVE